MQRLDVSELEGFVAKMARRGGGARGTTGPKLPASAPRHTAPKPGSKAWHAAKRSALEQQRKAATATAAAARGRHFPPLRHGGFKCASCGHHDWHAHPVMTKEGAHHPTLVMQGCARCGTMHPAHVGVLHKRQPGEVLDVVKDVDASETAIQRQDGPAVVGHRTNCPRGGDGPCGAERDGECTRCGALVRDHEAIGKSLNATVIDLRALAADL